MTRIGHGMLVLGVGTVCAVGALLIAGDLRLMMLVLAAFAVPMVLLTVVRYVRRHRLAFTEVVMSILLVGITIGSRDFVQLGLYIGDFPIYVTEILMVVLLVGMMVEQPKLSLPLGSKRFIVIYMLVGLVSLITHVADYGLAAVRDFALVYYSLFAFVAAHVASYSGAIERILRLQLYALTGALGMGVLNTYLGGDRLLTTTYGETRLLHGSYAVYFSLAIFVVLISNRLRIGKAVSLGLLGMAGLYLVQHRTAWIALGAGIAILTVFRLGDLWRRLITVGWLAITGASLALLVTGLSVLDLVPKSLLTVLNYETDPNAVWRLTGWKEILTQLDGRSWLGLGLGAPYQWYDQLGRLNTGAPHNSHLGIMYKMGFIGYLFFFATIATLVWQLWCNRTRLDTHHLSMLAVCGFILVYAAFNVLLEAPYTSVVFWSMYGFLGYGVVELQMQRSGASDLVLQR